MVGLPPSPQPTQPQQPPFLPSQGVDSQTQPGPVAKGLSLVRGRGRLAGVRARLPWSRRKRGRGGGGNAEQGGEMGEGEVSLREARRKVRLCGVWMDGRMLS